MRLCNAPVPDSYIYMPKIAASFLFGAVCHTIAGAMLFS